jgi:hypothetical protein
MNKEKVLEFAEKSYIDWYPYSDCTEKHLERFAELIEEEVRVTIKGEQKLIKQLVEAAESALEAMQSVAGEAYQRAEPVCCGRGGNECCGCPEPKWNSVDEVTMIRLHRPQQELTAALAVAKGEGW